MAGEKVVHVKVAVTQGSNAASLGDARYLLAVEFVRGARALFVHRLDSSLDIDGQRLQGMVCVNSNEIRLSMIPSPQVFCSRNSTRMVRRGPVKMVRLL